MTIFSEDGNCYVDVGNYEIWNCFYSTVITKLKKIENTIPLALLFLKNCQCESVKCSETAREFNIIRDNLSMLSVNELVYDYKKPNVQAPWQNNISPVVTSCGNFFTTADGKDLIYEIISVLCYADSQKQSVICQ